MLKLAALALAALLSVACVSPVQELAPSDGAEPAAAPPAQQPAAYASAPVLGEPPPALGPIRVYIAPEVSEQEEVRAGVDAWAQATEGVREWAYAASAEAADLAIYEIGPFGNTCAAESPEEGEVAETKALACVWEIGGLWNNQSGQAMPVFLIDGSSQSYKANAKLVTMHEIGHALGLTHRDGGIMQAGATRAMLAAAWECPDPVSVDRLSEKLHLSGLSGCAEPSW